MSTPYPPNSSSDEAAPNPTPSTPTGAQGPTAWSGYPPQGGAYNQPPYAGAQYGAQGQQVPPYAGQGQQVPPYGSPYGQPYAPQYAPAPVQASPQQLWNNAKTMLVVAISLIGAHVLLGFVASQTYLAFLYSLATLLEIAGWVLLFIALWRQLELIKVLLDRDSGSSNTPS